MLVGMAAIFSAVGDKKHFTTGAPRLNEWGPAGEWTIGKEHATLGAANGTVVYRFHARDLRLVLGPGSDGNRFGSA
jgi:Thioredoxin like C-terminal domain